MIWHRLFSKVGLLWCGWLCIASASAQNTDSLWHAWSDHGLPDTTRLQALGQLSWALMHDEPDSSLSLALLLYDEATAKELRSCQSLALNHQGVAYAVLGNFYAAHVAYEQMLELAIVGNDRRTIAGAHINLGAIHQQQGDNLRALDHYTQSVLIFEQLGDKRSLSSVYNNLGGIYNALGDTANALGYMRKSLEHHQGNDHRRAQASALGNMSLVYLKQNMLELSYGLMFESLGIRREIGDRPGMAKALSDLGEIHRKRGALDSALQCLLESRRIRTELHDEPGSIGVSVSLGFVSVDRGDHVEAMRWCGEGLRAARELGLLNEEMSACDCLYRAAKALGREGEALAHHERYTLLSDSLRNDEVRNELEQLEFKRRVQADSIVKAEAGARSVMLSEERQRVMSKAAWWGGGVALVLAIMAFVLRRKRSPGRHA